MIKKIYLKKTNTLDENEGLIELNFSDQVNIIVGPKGGGKSTLFDLLASISKGYISNDVIEALAAFDLQFIKAIKYNGDEEINEKQLIRKTLKAKQEDFINRNDVIFQDDPIKKNINTSKEIEKNKEKYLHSIIQTNPDVISSLYQKFKKFYDAIQAIISYEDVDINWTDTFKLKKIDEDANLLISLNYNPRDIIAKINSEINAMKSIIDCCEKSVNEFVLQHSNNNFNEIYKDEEFLNKFNEQTKKIIEEIQILKKLVILKEKKHAKIKKIIDCFAKAYNNQVDEIKKNNSDQQRLLSFQKKAKSHFEEMARKFFELKKSFNAICSEPMSIYFNDLKNPPKGMLEYRMKQEIVLTDEVITKLLKIILKVPTSFKSLYKWVEDNNNDKKKNFDNEKLNEKLVKELVNYVDVYADGKLYDKMSFGQKSIYGINYKYKLSINDILFLDQPEDNLDNETIAKNILDLINRKNNQVFIVTHNANIGILSNPKTIIIADLNNKQSPYCEGYLVQSNNNDTEACLFLEGGTNFLEQRYKIIKGEKHENRN